LNVIKTDIPGVLIIEPRVFGDDRGFFYESWQQDRYRAAGLPQKFVQDNVSQSRHGVLRGLHLQNPNAQGKLVYVLRGRVFDVAVDVRVGSPTFGKWTSVELSADNKRQFYIPPGLAHGFCVTSEDALFSYKCTDNYRPEAEVTIAWDDPTLAIAWPLANPTLSAKDLTGVPLGSIPKERLLKFGAIDA
jgi:dTDP-4-dehydrorhamnose 3,5-epimerase